MAKKSTLIENAQKYVQRGQFDRAVREYQKALKLDPKDLRIRQKIGGLFLRKGERNEALKELSIVAAAYASDGFYLKAVAVNKQLLKIRPDLFDVHQKLGELYHQLNLVSEAMEHYAYVVHFYEANQHWEDCADVYEQIVELKPDEPANYFKLAEFLALAEDDERVIETLQNVIQVLEGKGDIENMIFAYEKMLELDRAELSVHQALANLYMQAGYYKKALSSLQVCFTADSQDVDTLLKLAQAFEALNQMPKAVAVLKELARLHDYHGRHEEKREILSRVAKIDPSDPDVAHYFSTMAGATAPVPVAEDGGSLVAPLPEGVPLHSTEADAAAPALSLTPAITATGKLVALPQAASAALQQVDHMLEAGAVSRAIRHLKEAAVQEPNCFALHDRLRQLLLAKGDWEGASRVILMQVKLAVAARAIEPARAAVAYALALTPENATVQMLAGRLKVDAPAAIPQPSDTGPDSMVGERVVVRDDSAPTEDGIPASGPVRAPLNMAQGGHGGMLSPADDGLVEDDGVDNAFISEETPDLPAGFDDELVDDGGFDLAMATEEGSATGFNVDDGLVDDDDWTSEDEQTGTLRWEDGLVDDESDISVLASIGDGEDTGSLELDSIHLEPHDESHTLVGAKVSLENEKTAQLPDSALDDGFLVDDDDSFDLAAELDESPGAAPTPATARPATPRPADTRRGPYEMARAYIEMGLYDEAIRELHGLDFDAEGMHLMGLLQLGRGEYTVAGQWMEAALARPDVVQGQKAQIQFDLARSREALGQFYGALELYRGIFTQYRSFKAKEIRARIAAVTAKIQSSDGPQISH